MWKKKIVIAFAVGYMMEKKILKLNEILKVLNEYVDGINQIIPDRQLSLQTQAELRRFHKAFVTDLREVYLGLNSTKKPKRC